MFLVPVCLRAFSFLACSRFQTQMDNCTLAKGISCSYVLLLSAIIDSLDDNVFQNEGDRTDKVVTNIPSAYATGTPLTQTFVVFRGQQLLDGVGTHQEADDGALVPLKQLELLALYDVPAAHGMVRRAREQSLCT